MNGRGGYITTEITQSKGGRGRRRRLRERREAPRMREELGVPVLGREVLSPWDVGPSDSVYFSSPKQAVAHGFKNRYGERTEKVTDYRFSGRTPSNR